jgi:hypothetical protein
MKATKLSHIAMATALVVAICPQLAFTQDTPKQDIKNAGTHTKDAAKDTGHAVSKETQKGYHKTASGTKKAAHKTADTSKTAAHKTSEATRNTVDKVEGKPSPH